MAYYCANCGAELDYQAGQNVGRRDECPSCSADLHCCYNCEFHDSSSYNECRESQADRVLEKAQSNFCDYFKLKNLSSAPSGSSGKSDALKDLDDLFK